VKKESPSFSYGECQRDNRYVEVYRINQPIEVLEEPKQLSGENVLPGFVLDLNSVW